MVEFRQITKKNYKKVFNMTVTEKQKDFITDNSRAIAKAWVYGDSMHPFAIYNDNTMIGFIMFSYDEEDQSSEIQSIMIDANYQGQGYGKQAMQKVIDLIKAEGKTKVIHLDYAAGNVVAKHLYEELGFKFACEDDCGEIMMSMNL